MRIPTEADEGPKHFTPEDFQKLLVKIQEEWLKEVVVFAVLTGLRRGEVLNLRWRNVDLPKRLLHVQSSPTFKTKQGKRRTISVNKIAAQILAPRAAKALDDFAFTLNGRQILDTWAARLLKRYVVDAKLSDRRLHFHSLRHTFASWLVQCGTSLYEVQKLLGHSNPRVTQVYAHLSPSDLHDTVDRLSVQYQPSQQVTKKKEAG